MRTLVDEWVRAGIGSAVLAPGSRSTPLAIALDERVEVHVFHDERSAAYFALGMGAESGSPSILLCTSGTAAANFHPAVIEADASCVPMIVCTADRPPELVGTGANQAIDQNRLYGHAVRWYSAPGVADDHPEAERFWRSIASRSVAEATSPRAGPVHLDLAFREPLLIDEADGPVLGGRAGSTPWTVVREVHAVPDIEDLVAAIRVYDQSIVIAGRGADVSEDTLRAFAEAAGCPVLADPLSGLRYEGTISTYDSLLRSEEWAAHHYPYPVIRLGGPPTSKLLSDWTRHVDPQFVIASDPTWADPHRTANVHIVGPVENILREATALLHDLPPMAARRADWIAAWSDADVTARRIIDAECEASTSHFEGAVARDVAAAVPTGACLVVGSSMPVRDLESFAAPPVLGRVFANRGASGIDGMISTALGIAASSGAPTVCLLGDLAFLHDANGLIGASRRRLDVTIVVVDNDGGGIFEFLPQSAHPDFERLFATPHGSDLAAVAGAHGLPVAAPAVTELRSCLAERIGDGNVSVVHVKTDRKDNVARHRAVHDAVAAAIWP